MDMDIVRPRVRAICFMLYAVCYTLYAYAIGTGHRGVEGRLYIR
jgi:hypothetical protein